MGTQNGFTLIELVVAITILALISLISLPLMTDRGDGSEKRVLRRIAGVVKQLYNEATLTRDEFQLTFDLDKNRLAAFRLHRKDRVIEREPFGHEINLLPLKVQQVDVVGKGSFQGGKVSVRILPLGWMEQTRIIVAGDNGRVSSLQFSPLTGTAKIKDENRSL